MSSLTLSNLTYLDHMLALMIEEGCCEVCALFLCGQTS